MAAATKGQVGRLQGVMSIEAYQEQVLPVQHKLYRFGLRMLGSEEESRDVVQEVLLKVWAQRQRLADIRNAEAWCMTLCRNLCLDKLKLKYNQNASLAEGLEVLDSTATPYEVAESNDTMDGLRRLMDRLPAMQKQVLHLRDVEGYAYKEVADLLQIDVNMVKTYLFRARKAMRASIQTDKPNNVYGAR